MSVAAGTWRQGGPIGGRKEALTVVDPQLVAEQTQADRHARKAELIEGLILSGCSDFGIHGELGSDPLGWAIDALNVLPKKLHDAWRSPAQAAEERETGRAALHELADAVPGVGYRDVAHRYVDNLQGRRLDRLITQATAARNGATIREAAPGLEQTINIAVGLSMIAAGVVGQGTVQRLAEGDQHGPDHHPSGSSGPEWKLPTKVAVALGFFSQVLAACREFLQGETPVAERPTATALPPDLTLGDLQAYVESVRAESGVVNPVFFINDGQAAVAVAENQAITVACGVDQDGENCIELNPASAILLPNADNPNKSDLWVFTADPESTDRLILKGVEDGEPDRIQLIAGGNSVETDVEMAMKRQVPPPINNWRKWLEQFGLIPSVAEAAGSSAEATVGATETSTLVSTETPVLPLSAFISAETIGDGTVLVPILRAPLPPELSTFIPVDGKLTSGGGELTGLSGVKLCLGFESDATCYGVRAPAPEFLSRHLGDRVVTYRHDRDASTDGVQVYTTDETGDGIAPQQVFINRVPMRPGLHFETLVRDGSGQNDPGAGQLLMMWIDENNMKVVDELAQVRDFNPQTDRIDVDYANGVVTMTYADGRVEPFDIGRPSYPTVTPRPSETPTRRSISTLVPTTTIEVAPLPTWTPPIVASETPPAGGGDGFTIPHGSVPPLEDLGRCMQGGIRFEERDNQYLLSGVITNADATGINFASGARLNTSDITAGVYLIMIRNGNSLDSAWVELPYSLNDILKMLTSGQFVAFSKDHGSLGVYCPSR